MPTLSIPPSTPDPLQNAPQPNEDPRAPSPIAPPYSPITPTMTNSLPASAVAAVAAKDDDDGVDSTGYNNNKNNDVNKNKDNRKKDNQRNNRYQYPHAAPSAAPRGGSYAPPTQQSPSSYSNSYYTPLPSSARAAAAPPPPPPPTAQMPQQQQQQPPQPIPINESTNPDAIALRAAMSVLQLQRQQALRDMQMLERQKEAAVADPEGFARDVGSGRIKARGMKGILGPVGEVGDADCDGGGVGSRGKGKGKGKGKGGMHGGLEPDDGDDDGREIDDSGDEDDKATGAFGELPTEQNVVRMPPINWAKYHIVGESLNKLHGEQRARPVAGQPLRDEDLKPRQRAPEHVIASPYDPWRDKLEVKEKGRTRSGRGKG